MIPSYLHATARLGLPYLLSGQMQKHVTLNDALTRLDLLIQTSAISRSRADQPSAPQDGDVYLMPEGAVGADWTDRAAGDLMRWEAGTWKAEALPVGTLVYVRDDHELVVLTDDGWRVVGGGASDQLEALGIGTSADPANPLTVKANTALWTARSGAEGGTGDFRWVLNKTAVGDTGSLLFQTGYEGRAEIGLAGDDDLRIKVSSDGSAWRDAVRVDRDSGAVRVAGAGHLVRPETIRIVEAFTAHPGRRRVFVIDDLVDALVRTGVWNKLSVLYLLAAHDAQAARINLKSPGQADLTMHNGTVFTPDRGYAGDGATSYLSTGDVTLDTLTTRDDAHLGVWVQAGARNDSALIGSGPALGANSDIFIVPCRASSNVARSRMFDGSSQDADTPVTTPLGHTVITRANASTYSVWRDAAKLSDESQAAVGVPNAPLEIGRTHTSLGAAYYNDSRVGAAHVGAALSAQDMAVLYRALAAYLRAVEAL